MKKQKMNTQRMNTQRIARWMVMASVLLAPIVTNAHEYLQKNFLIIHPWSLVAEQGASDVVMGLTITDIGAADALLGAETPIAGNVRLVSADGKLMVGSGLEFSVGEEVVLQQGAPHLLLDEITMTLHWGREYPLVLHFRDAGAVDVSFVVGDD